MQIPTVVLLPMWAPGHFRSMLEAGKRMMLCSGGDAFRLTVLVMPPPPESAASEVTSQLQHRDMTSGHAAINFHYLPAVEHGRSLVHPSEYIRLYAPHVKDAIAGLVAAPVAAVVVDFFGAPLLDVARELAVPGYVYFASTAAMLALMLRLPTAHEEVTARLREMEGAVDVPGMPPVPAAAMPSLRLNDYWWFAYLGRRFMEARGIVVNTAEELERGVLAAIADGRCTPGGRAPPVYPIGPVLSLKPPTPRADDRSPPHECVRWLDARPPASVVFLCFGSMGWMDAEQAREVAAGLERSAQSFLWVLRGPPPAGGSRYPSDADLDALLPGGFLERTKGTGLVWPTWAPQPEILAHAAVGGFVTHCGWNSVLESLWHGVPMAPWPRYAEQPLNAFELVASMGVAVELKTCAGREGFVEAAELERATRSLMGGDEEGRKAREKAAEMKAACRRAVEKGGPSYAAMQRVVQDMLGSCVPR
ncbi:hypothetical protein ACP70R_004359 [Stipagrostis hirtigluma subsp. patula]